MPTALTAPAVMTVARLSALHTGAVAFIHRFSSSLNGHVHFHFCVVDGVFEEVVGEGAADAAYRTSPSGDTLPTTPEHLRP